MSSSITVGAPGVKLMEMVESRLHHVSTTDNLIELAAAWAFGLRVGKDHLWVDMTVGARSTDIVQTIATHDWQKRLDYLYFALRATEPSPNWWEDHSSNPAITTPAQIALAIVDDMQMAASACARIDHIFGMAKARKAYVKVRNFADQAEAILLYYVDEGRLRSQAAYAYALRHLFLGQAPLPARRLGDYTINKFHCITGELITHAPYSDVWSMTDAAERLL